MAQSVAKIVRYVGGRDVWGGHGAFFGNYTGPASYVNSGTFATSGETIAGIGGADGKSASQLPLRTIDSIQDANSVSGLYQIRFYPTAAGPTNVWSAHWFVISTGAEVANGVSLAAETAIVMGVGG